MILMMKENEKIILNWDESIEILKELNLIIVSLDKIGAYYIDRNENEFENEIVRVIVKEKFLRRLSKVRAIITAKFDNTLGDDDMDDLERAMEGLKYWEKPGDNLDE
jgi:hypothetical protein